MTQKVWFFVTSECHIHCNFRPKRAH